jgi:hypothetical protein
MSPLGLAREVLEGGVERSASAGVTYVNACTDVYRGE